MLLFFLTFYVHVMLSNFNFFCDFMTKTLADEVLCRWVYEFGNCDKILIFKMAAATVLGFQLWRPFNPTFA
jgi:hypothetical protein